MIRLLILVSLLLGPIISFAQDDEGKHRFSIEEIINNEDSDFYSTEGYVVRAENCNNDKQCRILINDEPRKCGTIIEGDAVKKVECTSLVNDLSLLTSPIQDFEVGKKYLFLIQKKKLDGKTTREVTDYHEIPEPN